MARDADQTRRRLLEAAVAEFAAFGIAGARVDRIAEAAGVNKAMIYSYFGNKDQLFDEVFTAHVGAFVEQVPFDAADLPGYAGRLFDRYEDHPETLRLATWYRLERPDGARLRAVVASNQTKLEKLAGAQRAGDLPDRYAPVELLILVLSISTSWAFTTTELGASAPAGREVRRRLVVDAVAHLLDQPTTTSGTTTTPPTPGARPLGAQPPATRQSGTRQSGA